MPPRSSRSEQTRRVMRALALAVPLLLIPGARAHAEVTAHSTRKAPEKAAPAAAPAPSDAATDGEIDAALDAYERAQRKDLAAQVAEAQLKKLDLVKDSARVVALSERLRRYQEASAASVDTALQQYDIARRKDLATSLIEAELKQLDPIRSSARVTQLHRRLSDYKDEQETADRNYLFRLLEQPTPPLPDSDRARKQRLQGALASLKPERAEDDTLIDRIYREVAAIDERLQETFLDGVLADLKKLGLLLAKMLIFAVLFAAVYLLPRVVRRSPRSEISLQLVDATGTASAQADSDLQQLFVCESRKLTKEGVGVTLDPLVRALLAFSSPAPVVDSLKAFADDQALVVGGFKISPKQILAMLEGWWSRPFARTLSGTLTEQAGVFRFTLRETSGGAEAGKHPPDAGAAPPAVWSAEEPSRYLAVQSIVLQYAVTGQSAATNQWKSLRAYLEGDSLVEGALTLPGAARHQALEKAAASFEAALQIDPANWLARFKYALVLGHLNRLRAARSQFGYLRDVLDRKDKTPLPAHLAKHIEKVPYFEWLVYYNHGFATAKLAATSASDRQYASSDLDAVCSKLDEARKKIPEKLRSKLDESMQWHVECLKSLGHLAVMERIRFSNELTNPDQNVANAASRRQEQALTEIRRIEELLWAKVRDGKLSEALTYTHSNAQYARGRASFIARRGEDPEAEQYLRWAMEIHLPVSLADPLVALASLYVARRARRSLSWAEDATSLLERALQFDPDNPKAHYLLGLIQLEGPVPDYRSAEEHLRRGEDRIATRLKRATALTALSRHADALRLIDEALEIAPESTALRFSYCDVVIDAKRSEATAGKVRSEDVERAFQLAGDVVHKSGASDRERAAAYQKRLRPFRSGDAEAPASTRRPSPMAQRWRVSRGRPPAEGFRLSR